MNIRVGYIYRFYLKTFCLIGNNVVICRNDSRNDIKADTGRKYSAKLMVGVISSDFCSAWCGKQMCFPVTVLIKGFLQ